MCEFNCINVRDVKPKLNKLSVTPNSSLFNIFLQKSRIFLSMLFLAGTFSIFALGLGNLFLSVLPFGVSGISSN